MEEQIGKIVEIVKNQIKEKMIMEESTKKQRKRFFVSDTHFNDSRLNLYGRDIRFKNAKEVNDHIIKVWNESIGKNDLVYHLGDISMDREGLDILNQLNGEKILIKGNYDISVEDGGTAKYEINDKILLKYFSKVYDDLEIEIGGETVYLNHYPINIKEEKFTLCGHVHNIWHFSRNSINVGIDTNHFTPVGEELIVFQMNAIRKYYDQNCFPNEFIASVKNRIGKTKVLIAPEYNKVATFEENKDIHVFMAGPAQGCQDWQSEFIEKIQNELKNIKSNKDIVLCSPRRLEKPKNFIYEEQIEWESYHLEKSAKQGLVVFWFAKESEKIEGRSFARTSRVEIGEWMAKGQTIPGFKMIVGYEKGFDGFEYIEERLKKIDSQFEMSTNKNDMIDEVIKQIKKML